MKLVINGESLQVPESIRTVADLLRHYGLDRKVLIVELNQSVLEKSGHAEAALSDGDRIEIVHFVGGG